MVSILSFVSGCDNRIVVKSDHAILGLNMFIETLHVEESSSREGSYMSVLLKSATSSSGLR